MEFNFKKPMPARQPKGEGCKIKIKNTASGRQIEFSGNCSKEQLEMAKMNMNSEEKEED
jgi:hypothetical protein